MIKRSFTLLSTFSFFFLTGVNIIFISLAQGASLYSSPHIRIEIENLETDKVSLQAHELLKQHAQSTMDFLHTQVHPLIPQKILKRIQQHSLKIILKKTNQRHGLFIANSEGMRIEIDSKIFLKSSFKLLLAHEYFHAIHHILNPGEETWVKEGLAQVFEHLATKTLNSHNIHASFNNISTSLIEQYDISLENKKLYGHHFLYFYYLLKNCGQDDLLWTLSQGARTSTGAEMIDSVLKGALSINLDKKQCHSFKESFIHFEIARVLNKKLFWIDGNKNKYQLLHTSQKASLSELSPPQLQETYENLPPYTPLYLDFQTYNQIRNKRNSYLHIWIEQKFPYSVLRKSPPKNKETFNVLILNTN